LSDSNILYREFTYFAQHKEAVWNENISTKFKVYKTVLLPVLYGH